MPRKLTFAAWKFWMTKMIATMETAAAPMSRALRLVTLSACFRGAALGCHGRDGPVPVKDEDVPSALGVPVLIGLNVAESGMA